MVIIQRGEIIEARSLLDSLALEVKRTFLFAGKRGTFRELNFGLFSEVLAGFLETEPVKLHLKGDGIARLFTAETIIKFRIHRKGRGTVSVKRATPHETIARLSEFDVLSHDLDQRDRALQRGDPLSTETSF
jgi:hypothetical protein